MKWFSLARSRFTLWWDEPVTSYSDRRGIAVDGFGNSYEMRPHDIIKRYVDGTRAGHLTYGPGEDIYGFQGMPNGQLLVSGVMTPAGGTARPLVRFMSSDDVTVAAWDVDTTGLTGGSGGVAVDGPGNLYVLAGGKVRKYAPDHSIAWTISTPPSVGSAGGIIAEASGGVYVIGGAYDVTPVARLDVNGQVAASFVLHQAYVRSRIFASDPTGGFFWTIKHDADYASFLLLIHVSPSGQEVEWLERDNIQSLTDTYPTGLGVDGLGRPYLMGNTSVRRYNPNAGYDVIFSARLNAPNSFDFDGPSGASVNWGLAVDATGNHLYAANGWRGDMRGGIFVTHYDVRSYYAWPSCQYNLTQPDAVSGGLALDGAGNTVMVLSGGVDDRMVGPTACPVQAPPRLRTFTPQGLVSTHALDTMLAPITTGPDNSFYGAVGTSLVQRRSATDGALVWSQPLVPTYGNPSVMMDSDRAGNLYVALASDQSTDTGFTSLLRYAADGTRTWHVVPTPTERAWAMQAMPGGGMAVGFRSGVKVYDARGELRWSNNSATWLMDVDGYGDLVTLSWELKVDSAGNDVLDGNGNGIWVQTFRRLSSVDGAVIWRTEFAPADASLYPNALVVDATGTLRVACLRSSADGTVTMLSWNGATGAPLGAQPPLYGLGGATVQTVLGDAYGNVWIAGSATQDPFLPGPEIEAPNAYLSLYSWQ